MNRFTRLLCASLLLSLGSCARNSNQTWEDLKTAGRYMHRGVDAVFGKDYESRLLTSDDEFVGPYDDEFIPLRDADLRSAYAAGDSPIPQPRGIPGQKGVPSLSEFYAAPDTLRMFFQPVHFETDEHVLKNKHDLESLVQLAAFLRKNPNTYIVVEGHCDERASASYNMALGMRRANYVRSFLVKQGADMNRIYTVSRGKEQPLTLGHNSEDWKLNRRSEFKMYEK
jgi:peptidoglycan-associated lipoprotein